MRITGGLYSRRRLTAPKGAETRPTADRTRAAVFNILRHSTWGHPEGKTVLDGFCGTGALGLEALSHGARQAVFIDNAQSALDACRQNIATLGLEAQTQTLKYDLSRPMQMQAGPFDLAFLDPPYGLGLGTAALENIFRAGWLSQNAVIVFECEKNQPEAIPDSFESIDERCYGNTKICFLKIKAQR